MSEQDQVADFEDAKTASDDPDGAFVVDVDGYEGPLDLLLNLAREQKVDLTRISILELANQYLEFVEQARHVRLELAAEYLVMAAWLAYLKSRLLLPEPDTEEPSGEEMAARLSFQLQRLDAMREAAEALMGNSRVGIDVFQRGAPEGVTVIRNTAFECSLFDLLKAYATHRESRGSSQPLRLRRDQVFAIERALGNLRDMLGAMPDWTTLQTFLPPGLVEPFAMRSATASTFAASLEMVKQGQVEIRQSETFGPIYLRRNKNKK